MDKVNLARFTARRCLVVVPALALLSTAFSPGRAQAQQPAGGRPAAGKPVSVEVVKPLQRALVRELKMPATLMADEQVELFSKVSGYVAEIQVDIGSRVNQGDVLAEISVPEMADELRQAEAVLKAKRAKVRALQAKVVQAQRMVDTAQAQVQRYAAEHELDQINLDRKQELHQGKAIPAQALDEARSAHAITEAQLQIARARVAGAQAEQQAADADVEVAESEVMVSQANIARLTTLMEYASIKAPFDGVITVRNVDHGTFVRSAAEGTTVSLLRIAKTDRIRIVLGIPEPDAPYVRIGTAVSIHVKALDDEPFAATVTRTAAALKPETRTMRAEVDVDNQDGRLTPGMYAQVVVELESKSQATVIPSKAIRVRGKATSVLVAADGVARDKPIEVGYDDGVWAEILSGLDGQESVITATSGAITPGASVRPVFSDS
ncbi:MAG: efflux RND transporter periplasmic adaptor subunit [Planctomycetota bacterium]|jgi:RND family efflux transporter MFP subunit